MIISIVFSVFTVNNSFTQHKEKANYIYNNEFQIVGSLWRLDGSVWLFQFLRNTLNLPQVGNHLWKHLMLLRQLCIKIKTTDEKISNDNAMNAIDIETFEKWMQKIMLRFDENERLLASLTGKEFKEVKYFNGERLLDNQDLCQLLQTSKRSVQRYRSSGTLKYQMLWHKVYYKESDVQEFLRTHFEEFGQQKPEPPKTGTKKQ